MDYDLLCVFIRGNEVEKHKFEGFSIGYGGEGPRGFEEFCKIFDIPSSKSIAIGGNHFKLNDVIFSDKSMFLGIPQEGTFELTATNKIKRIAGEILKS